MLVSRTAQLEELVGEFSAAGSYALDTEFHHEGTYYPRLALIQLAVPGRVAVVDATAVDVGCLKPLIAGPGVMVTHSGGQDVEIIQRACGARPARVFDTQIAAGFLGYGMASLGSLLMKFLGVGVDKSHQTSDWFKRPLSAEQVAYAETDVVHLLELRARLETRLAEAGRLAWVNDECERFAVVREPDDDTAWWRLKGSRRLTGKARGRAQALAAWRERTAREADRPVRSILPDDFVVAVAERPPGSVADLPRSRMFDPRKLSPARAREIVAVAAQGAELTPEEILLPRDGLPQHLDALAGLMAAWVQQRARDLTIDTALLATRRDIEAFLLHEPDLRVAEGWRAEVIGAALGEIAAGRAAVAYDGNGRLVLVDRAV